MDDVLEIPSAPTDAQLIAAVRRGDTSAYAELFSRHRDAAVRLARQLTRDGEADDLVSEAFTRVLVLLQAGKGPDEAFRAYLLTSIRRLHVDRVRSTTRTRPTDDEKVLDRGVPFDDAVAAAFENDVAARAFSSLPERWQLVLWHLEVEGQKPADVAPLLGMSPNSVSALAYRAREGLRQAYLESHATTTDDASCRAVTGLLGGFVRQGLSARDTTKVDRHLDGCRRCTGVYLELVEVNQDLRAILAPALLGQAAAGYLGAASAAGAATAGVAAVGTATGSLTAGAFTAGGTLTSGSALASSGSAALSTGGIVTGYAGTSMLTTTIVSQVARAALLPAQAAASGAVAAGAPTVVAATVVTGAITTGVVVSDPLGPPDSPQAVVTAEPTIGSTVAPPPDPTPEATEAAPEPEPEPTASENPVPAPTTTAPEAAATIEPPPSEAPSPPPTQEPTPEPPPVTVTDFAAGTPQVSRGSELGRRHLVLPITADGGSNPVARTVTVTVAVDRHVQFVSAGNGWTCDVPSRSIVRGATCTSLLPAGSGGSFPFSFSVLGTPKVTLRVSAPEDPRPDNDTASVRLKGWLLPL